jgi:hypothetical protein
MNRLWMASALCVALSACGGAEGEWTPEADELGQLQSALIIPTESPSVHICTGYTSGGGQRVDGSLTTHLFQADVDGVMTDFVAVHVGATNYKRNIGWSRKPTGQLAIDIDVNGTTDRLDTNGETVSSIGFARRFEYVSGVGPVVSVRFHGRDGSTCAL